MNLHFANTTFCRNIGDAASSPIHYWRWPVNAVHLDTRNYVEGPVIFGGGGLLMEGMDQHLLRAFITHSEPKIAWGIGLNYTDGVTSYPEWLRYFNLVGVRDFNSTQFFPYVPCASCMHPAFDQVFREPEFDYVIYQHGNLPPILPDSIAPRMSNYSESPMAAVDDVIRFLACGKAVVTNCYHGVYWAQLVNRPVLCMPTSSNKFKHFEHPPVTIDPAGATEFIPRHSNVPSDFLQTCRERNIAFQKQVVELIEKI